MSKDCEYKQKAPTLDEHRVQTLDEQRVPTLDEQRVLTHRHTERRIARVFVGSPRCTSLGPQGASSLAERLGAH